MFWTEMLLNPNIIGLCFSTAGLKMMKEGKILENSSFDPPRFFYTPLKSNIGPQNGIHLATFIAVFTNHDAEKSRFIETVMYGSRFLRTAALLYVYEAETQLITCHHFQTSSPHYIKSSKNQLRFSPFC